MHLKTKCNVYSILVIILDERALSFSSNSLSSDILCVALFLN